MEFAFEWNWGVIFDLAETKIRQKKAEIKALPFFKLLLNGRIWTQKVISNVCGKPKHILQHIFENEILSP
jgi:hypothetical protein